MFTVDDKFCVLSSNKGNKIANFKTQLRFKFSEILATGDLSCISGKKRTSLCCLVISTNVREYGCFTCTETSFLPRPTDLALCPDRIKSEERKTKIILVKRKQHPTFKITVQYAYKLFQLSNGESWSSEGGRIKERKRRERAFQKLQVPEKGWGLLEREA